jgi:hypothetical protein
MAVIDLKNEKRINNNGEWDKVTTHPNNEPIFRQNGYDLQLDRNNSDYLDLGTPNLFPTFGDVDVSINVYLPTGGTSQNGVYMYGFTRNRGIICFWRPDISAIIITLGDTAGVDLELLNTPYSGGQTEIEIKNGLISINGTQLADWSARNTLDLSSIPNKQHVVGFYKNGAGVSVYSDIKIQESFIDGESFNPINIDSNAQIQGSSGTVAEVTSSAADPINHILGTVFQKSSFALVGNGTTEKIVGHLGTDLILTATPLEGGFTLDGVVYNLQEGLGNEIKSTTGETATIEGFTGTGLNFGGWQKGDSVNGWNPYTT